MKKDNMNKDTEIMYRFQPDTPVNPENFEGRKDIIEECMFGLNQAVNSYSKHFFVTGKRGMGKSSLASYIKECAKRKYKMVGVHVYNDGVHTTEDLITHIIEETLKEIASEKWSDKIYDKFKNHVESMDFLGCSIKFKPQDETLIKHVKNNFASFLVDLIKHFDDKNGIFIVIDDINGLTDTPEFAFWYKSFADSLATNFRGEANIAIMLTGYEEKLEKLYYHNPSFTRIFKHLYLNPLSDVEVAEFYKNSFKKLNVEIDENALKEMVYFSSGFPTMMQEIGAGIFWNIDEEEKIDKEIALAGIIRAGEEIGFKYLKPALDSSIRSEKYLSIFNKLGYDYLDNYPGEEYTFRKKEFIEKLDENESKVFSDFLRKARELGIIEFTGAKKSGHYKFTNNLYSLYFAINSLKEN